MKTSKRVFLGVIAIVIVSAALVFALLDALIPLNIWTHPVLNFLFAICAGFGIMALAFGFKKSSPWYFFLSSILLGLAFFYVLMQYVLWWICLIIVVVVWTIFGIVSFMSAGNQTEDIALNKSPDYKTFEQRKAEKANQEPEGKKELPKIKSFKD